MNESAQALLWIDDPGIGPNGLTMVPCTEFSKEWTYAAESEKQRLQLYDAPTARVCWTISGVARLNEATALLMGFVSKV